MRFLLALSALVAVASASGVPTLVVPFSTQYHAQDALGQYSYGYSDGLSAKAEARSLDGRTVGGYSYVDANGQLQRVEYTSDQGGFRVAASNLPVAPKVPEVPVLPLPVPVQDTPEVAEAKAKHLAAVEEAKVRSATANLIVPTVELKTVAASPAVVAAAVPVLPAVAALQPVAVPAPVAPASDPVVEARSSAVEPKSAPGKLQAAPLAAEQAKPPAPVAVRSFLSPTIAVGPAPLGYTYSFAQPLINYNYNTIVAEPAAVTAYSSYTFGPQLYAALPGPFVQAAKGEKAKNE